MTVRTGAARQRRGHGIVSRGCRVARRRFMTRFWKEDDGQGLVEYALIIIVIAIAVIVAMLFLRDQLVNQFSNIGNNLT